MQCALRRGKITINCYLKSLRIAVYILYILYTLYDDVVKNIIDIPLCSAFLNLTFASGV